MSVQRGFFSRRSVSWGTVSWGTALVLAAAVPVAGLVVPSSAAAAAPATTAAPAAGAAAPAATVWSAPTKVHREAYEVSPAQSPNGPTGGDQSPPAQAGVAAPAEGSVRAQAGAKPATPVLVSPAPLWRFTYSPVLSASYADPEGDAGTVTFTVRDHTGATVTAVTSTVVTSGSTASVDLAAAPLATGWYSWSAKASDGTSTSSSSSARAFHVAVAHAPVSRAGVSPAATFEDFDLADRVRLQVNVGTGNLMLRAKDLAIAGTAGHNLSLDRVYNSRHTSESTREMGRGWSLGPGQHVGLYHGPGNAGRDLVYEDETQARWTLTWVAGPGGVDSWSMPAGLNATLTLTPAGLYALTFRADKRTLTLDRSGSLTEIRDRSGNLIDSQYGGAGQYLTRIVDTQGRATDFRTSSSTHRLSGLTDPAGRRVDYTYSGDNLTAARGLDGTAWIYAYASDLTRVTDPRGNQTRITYTVVSAKVTAITRVTDTAAGTGPTTTFAYHGRGLCPTPGIGTACTVVTDPNGNPTSYGTDSADRVIKTVDAAGHTRDTGYDTLGNVIALTGNGSGPPPRPARSGTPPGPTR